MTTEHDSSSTGLTRRHLIAGGAAAAAGAALIGTAVGAGHAGATAPAGFVPKALDPAIAGLAYKSFDGVAFDVIGNPGAGGPPANYTFWQENTGAQPITPNTWLHTSLDLPVGAVVRQINALYQTQPIVAIRERSFATGAITDVFLKSMDASPGGAFASSETVDPPVVIKPACTYQLRFYCGPGTSIMGATVGYSPAAFSPFAGAPAAARVLDTRVSGGKFAAGEERVLDLSGATPIGTAVVLNLTADQPEGTGYLSAYSGDISFPGTSSLNFSPATPNIANTTTVVLGSGNKIKLRAGEAATHVIADVVGYLL